jgi:hypothetical protein
MTNHLSLGHTGENMDGTDTYDVCIVFKVHASNDDDALDTVINYLPAKTFPMDWDWIYTTQTERESTNDNSNDNQ